MYNDAYVCFCYVVEELEQNKILVYNGSSGFGRAFFLNFFNRFDNLKKK